MRQVKELRPTIWRTVRAMQNERRLRFMRLVFQDGGGEVRGGAAVSMRPQIGPLSWDGEQTVPKGV